MPPAPGSRGVIPNQGSRPSTQPVLEPVQFVRQFFGTSSSSVRVCPRSTRHLGKRGSLKSTHRLAAKMTSRHQPLIEGQSQTGKVGQAHFVNKDSSSSQSRVVSVAVWTKPTLNFKSRTILRDSLTKWRQKSAGFRFRDGRALISKIR